MSLSLNAKLGISAGGLVCGAVTVWLGVWWSLTQPAAIGTSAQTIERANTIIAAEAVAATTDVLVSRHSDGVLVSAGTENTWPIALMIENAAFGGVRPQSGLGSAQVIYELPVEGGITRFLALFAGELPNKIGPIRSARPTYLEFSSEYDALFGHAGGSPEALEAVDGLAVKDLSGLGVDARFFFRDGTLVAPHNLFTSGELLTKAREAKGLTEAEPTYEPWLFKEDTPVNDPTVEPLQIDFGSGPLYAVDYTYNPKTNSYDRANGGETQTDAVDGEVLSPKTVIVQIVPAAILAGDEGRVNYDLTGSGKLYLAQDGLVTEGTWGKVDRSSRTIFRDADGNRLALNRGQIWISIVPTSGTITLPSE
ncbi:MAG: DUF3048 domain-containing protein [Candidatus Kerfeldbacteria bacterium]|nr:DUF3048 domain-containing protein [Candidatus Kerfeldbacteria bacterium]